MEWSVGKTTLDEVFLRIVEKHQGVNTNRIADAHKKLKDQDSSPKPLVLEPVKEDPEKEEKKFAI